MQDNPPLAEAVAGPGIAARELTEYNITYTHDGN